MEVKVSEKFYLRRMHLRRVIGNVLLLGISCAASYAVVAQPKTDPAGSHGRTDAFLEQLLRSGASPALLHVLNNPDSFRYQLIYTRIDRDKNNRPHFHNYFLRVNPLDYFNPASTVKLPLALLALEKIDSLAKIAGPTKTGSLEKVDGLAGSGIDRDTPMLTDSSYSGQTAALIDSSDVHGLPSVGQYIRKIFLVSDNDAYNRLYEFLGQGPINRRLWQLGYPDIRITRRFVPMTEDENRHTNAIRFMRDGQMIYRQPPAVSDVNFDFSHSVLIGNAYYDRHDSLIHAPMDFTRHNNFPLQDAQRMLQSVLFPESVPASQRFRLSAGDYRFLYTFMSEFPRESTFPHYDTAEYFDSYAKFFFFRAGKGAVPSYIRSFNKPGWSYGFLTDIAYIADFTNNVEFMLTGTIYVNSDGILNDDKYEYEEVGWPFFKEVGSIIYRYELGRKREYRPDLSAFKMNYSDRP